MSSISFKKPNKRTFRRKQADGDSDDDSTRLGEPIEKLEESPITVVAVDVQVPEIPKLKREPTFSVENSAVSYAAIGVSNLSFGDDEGDTEEFRIKKSSRSRRLASKLKEERKENTSKGLDTDLKSKYGVEQTQGRAEEHTEEPKAPEIIYDADIDDEEGTQFRHPTKYLNGKIPDKKLIDEMKKRREAARKAEEEDYIPLDDTDRITDSKSRLIREDENDVSDEDEVGMSRQEAYLGSKDKEAANRRRNREFFELDEMIGHVAEDSDEETQRWEEAQIRKGVSLPQIQAFSDEINRPGANQSFEYAAYDSYYISPTNEEIPLAAMNTVEDIRKKIRNRMELSKDLQRRHVNEAEKLNGELKDCHTAVESLEMELQNASFEYKFYQEMRGFVMDVIDCYNEKLPQIVAAEKELLAVWRNGATSARELRQQFIKDQAEEIHCKHSILDSIHNHEQTAKRRIRIKEHVERRRNIATIVGIDEQNLDLDEFELPQANLSLPSPVKLFEDTAADFCSLTLLMNRFNQWRSSCSESYNDAYIALCLPKLLAPLIRYQLLNWNLLKKDSVALIEMPWFREIIVTSFTTTSISGITVYPKDPNLLIPVLITEDVLFPKITELLEIWDPFSTLQTIRLSDFLKKAFQLFPLAEDIRKPVKDLFSALVIRMKKSVDDEVFIPIYPQRILDANPEAQMFVAKQFGSALKLFRNILMFHGILSNAALIELAIHRLLDLYLLTPIRTCHDRSESIRRSIMITEVIPDDHLKHGEMSSTLPKHLEAFCHAMLNLGKQNPNCNEVASLKTCLLRLKDFKGAEILEKQLMNIQSESN